MIVLLGAIHEWVSAPIARRHPNPVSESDTPEGTARPCRRGCREPVIHLQLLANLRRLDSLALARTEDADGRKRGGRGPVVWGP